MSKKALTIKLVDETDIEKFNALKEQTGFTPAKTFAHLIKGTNNEETAGLLEGLRKEIENLKLVNLELTTVNQALEVEKTNLQLALEKETALKTEAALLVDELQARGAEVKEVPIPLTGNQFICDPSDEVLRMSRKYRSFLKKDGLMPAEVTDDEYPSRLFELAVKRYLSNKYE